MQISIKTDKRKMQELESLLAHIKNGVPKVLAGAVNDTARSTVTWISKVIRGTVNIKKKDIDPHLTRTKANYRNPTSLVRLKESIRLSLKYFGARQTKAGVTYKIDKKGKRSRIDRAFISPELGGHVYMRAVDTSPGERTGVLGVIDRLRGKKAKAHKRKGPPFLVHRLKIHRKGGISPWGAFVKSGLDERLLPDAAEKLEANINRKVAWLLAKNPRALIPDAT